MVILSAADWVCIFVCSLDVASCTGCYWWLGGAGSCIKWFPLCEFSLFDTPRVSSPEKAMAPHYSTLAWKIPWRRSLVGCSPWGRKELDMAEWLHFHFSLLFI